MAKLDWNKARQRQPDPATVIEPTGYERPSNWKPPSQLEEEAKQRQRDEEVRRAAAIAERDRLQTIDWELRVRSKAKSLRRAQLQGKDLSPSEAFLVSRWIDAKKIIAKGR
jgi:hypothetical protein